MRACACLLALSTLALEACKGCSDQQLTPTDAVGSDTPAHDVGSWLSMRAMPDGSPAVAYYDRTMGGLGFAIGTVSNSEGQDGGVLWSSEEVDSFPDENGLNPGDAGKYASLATNGEGEAWVSYQDTTNGTAKYAHRDVTGTWTVNLADRGSGPSSDAGYWTSMAMDSTGSPFFAHYDKGGGALRLARWSGTSFTGTELYAGQDYVADDGSGTEAGDAGEYAKVYVADDGTEYVAFYDRAWGALRLATGGPSGYATELVDDEGDVGQWPDIAVVQGDVYIAYQDVTNQQLKLANNYGGTWTTEVVDDGDYVGADAAIYATSTSVGVLYQDAVNNDVKVARQRDGAWASETVAGNDGALGFHNETVLAGGTRYAACYDYTHRSIWFAALP